MRKLAFTLILVSSISLLTLNAFGGDLEPSEPPGPTMHSLNEIYDLVVNNTVPRYEYKYFEDDICETLVTIHNGSGVVHSIIVGGSFFGSFSSVLELKDGSNTICMLNDWDQRVVPLDISYKNSLRLRNYGGCAQYVTVVYKPDN